MRNNNLMHTCRIYQSDMGIGKVEDVGLLGRMLQAGYSDLIAPFKSLGTKRDFYNSLPLLMSDILF